MERLTKRLEDGTVFYNHGRKPSSVVTDGMIIEQLSAYEDTGLTPGMATVALDAITGLAGGDRELALNSLQKLAEELEATP